MGVGGGVVYYFISHSINIYSVKVYDRNMEKKMLPVKA